MKKSEMLRIAELGGLTVGQWAPGDGQTRYRFFTDGDSCYDHARGIYTALGVAEASAYVRGYMDGKNAAAVQSGQTEEVA
jgi:hypothetical protein